jgi:hypothetical protein
MIKRRLLALALVSMHSALAFASGSAEPVPSAGSYAGWRAAAAQVLIGRGDADSLATAAALEFVGSSKSEAVELAAKASELAPDNPSIAWLRLQLCAGSQGCDIRDAATTMRWLDADNGAVWMATLAVAQKDKDSMEVDRTLQEMAQGPRFDLYRNRMVVLMFGALRRAGGRLPPGYVSSDSSRLSEALVITGAEIVPSFTPLLSACHDTQGADRRENCLRLSKNMQRADSVAAQMAGFTLEKRLCAPDSREARLVAEHRRVLEWRVATASEHDLPLLPWSKNSLARALVSQMQATPREEDVDLAILRKRKLPLDPPVEDHHP